MNGKDILLDVQNLRGSVRTPRGTVQAVSDASFRVLRGEEQPLHYTGIPVFTGWPDEE